jgi:PAS domain S-box-containing protein
VSAGRAWRSAAVLAGLVAVLGAAGSLAAGGVLAGEQRRAADQQLQRRASLVTARVAAEARRYTDAVAMAGAALGWREALTAESFHEVTEPVVRMRLPGATSMVFLAPATRGELAAVQRLWRARGADDLVLTPAGTGAEHIFTIFGQSLDGQQTTAGVDFTRAAEPAFALWESRAGRRTVVSDAYQLIQDRDLPAAERQLSFVVTAPVLAPADPTGRRAFRGWVLLELRGQDFIGAALQEASQDLVDVTLRAHSAAGLVDIAALRADARGRRDLRAESNVRLANRSWSLEFAAPGVALPGGRTGLPTVLASAGSVVSLLLAGLVWVLATGRARARTQVAAATSALKRTAAEVASQKDYLTQVVDAVHVTIMTCDVDGNLVHTNITGRDRLGTASVRRRVVDTVAGLQLLRTDGSPLDPVDTPLLRALRGDEVDGEEFVRIRADGTRRHLINHSRALYGPYGELVGAVSSSYDITALREREAELAAFAGIVAHDLKNPLTSLTGYTEIVRDDLADRADLSRQAGMLDRVLRTGVRMRQLIDDLLAFAAARDGAIAPVDVDLRSLVDQVVEERLATAGSPMPQIYVGALDDVHADPAMLRQLVDNLIGNAVKYTPPGQPARIDIATVRTGDEVRIEIADHGIGIPAGQHQAVFNDFHRAHPGAGYAGTGLGLAICRRIVTRHGGTIGVSDNIGGGARFHVTLPAAGAVTARPAGTARPAVHRTTP